MRGAGGTSGGVGEFFIGFVMMCGGIYMLLQNITVTNKFSLGVGLYRVGWLGVNITSGMILIPFIFGVGIIFYNSKNIAGWLLSIGSLVAMIFGVISNIQFSMRSMTAFELITILVLGVGGLGLFLRSLKNFE